MTSISHTAVRRTQFAFEKRVFFVLSVFLVVFTALYVYFLGISIVYAAERGAFENEREAVAAEVAQLEAVYLTHSNALTQGTAYEYGFVAAATPTFITRGSLSYVSGR